MKKLVFAIVFVCGLLVACTEDFYNQCPNELYCDHHDACCPVGYSFSCGGMCYSTYAGAWNNCGSFGFSIDQCYVE